MWLANPTVCRNVLRLHFNENAGPAGLVQNTIIWCLPPRSTEWVSEWVRQIRQKQKACMAWRRWNQMPRLAPLIYIFSQHDLRSSYKSIMVQSAKCWPSCLCWGCFGGSTESPVPIDPRVSVCPPWRPKAIELTIHQSLLLSSIYWTEQYSVCDYQQAQKWENDQFHQHYKSNCR